MPTYQYECDSCQHTFEVFQSMLDKRLKTCPQCGRDDLYRLIGAGSGIIFKGSGFYETDYKNKGVSSGTSGNSESIGNKEVKSKSDAEPAKSEPKKGSDMPTEA